MGKEAIKFIQEELKDKKAEEVLNWALGSFKPNEIAFASSFGAEDQIITDMIAKSGKSIGIFTIETLRLPKETHDTLEETEKKYGIKIEVLFPDKYLVTKMEDEYGKDFFYESVEKRKMCCSIRKVEPLKRKLTGLKAWVCGLRKEQSTTRSNIEKIEWDEALGLFKINPLADWTEAQVWEYIRKNNVPYNKLHDKGYPSIGCEPCTKAVKPGDDIRSGRWWWESKDSKECGLHIKKEKGK